MRHAFQSYRKLQGKDRFKIEDAVKDFTNNQNQKVHSMTGWRTNRLIITEDEETI